jgi:uncharacterized protein (TIGR03118 family)
MVRIGLSSLRATVTQVISCVVLFLVAVAPAQAGPTYSVTNLITNSQNPNPPEISDPNLVNPWGVSFGPLTPLWVSNYGPGVASAYSISRTDQVSIVQLPSFPVMIQGGAVTGQAFNPGFGSSVFNGDLFLLVTQGGAVEGWRPALGNFAENLASGSPANVYTGSTLVTVNGNEYLLAANNKTGNIDVFKGSVGQPDLPGRFVDPNLPAGFAPYNVQVLNGVVYVTYFNTTTGKSGIVDAFSTSGIIMARVAAGGALGQPWGLAIAPTSFGPKAGDLLVGNLISGQIDAFNLANNTPDGTLNGPNGQPITMPGLWSLTTGNNEGAGNSQEVYFTAGLDNYANGALGAIKLQSVPEPSTVVLGLIALGLATTGVRWKNRRCRAKVCA